MVLKRKGGRKKKVPGEEGFFKESIQKSGNKAIVALPIGGRTPFVGMAPGFDVLLYMGNNSRGGSQTRPVFPFGR